MTNQGSEVMYLKDLGNLRCASYCVTDDTTLAGGSEVTVIYRRDEVAWGTILAPKGHCGSDWPKLEEVTIK